MKKTLVIGASENSDRYSNKAVRMLKEYHHPVVAVGLKPGNIDDVTIDTGRPNPGNIDTVTMYVGAKNQPAYYDYILSVNPKRIIFNPGAENPELMQIAAHKGIEVIEACTLVMLRTGDF